MFSFGKIMGRGIVHGGRTICKIILLLLTVFKFEQEIAFFTTIHATCYPIIVGISAYLFSK